jgi:uncharacterized membrane protein YbaN (DUF454 family)
MLSLNNIMNKILKKVLGIIIIIIGVIGLFLPFIQGILLIITGLMLFDEKKFEYLKNKFIKKKEEQTLIDKI